MVTNASRHSVPYFPSRAGSDDRPDGHGFLLARDIPLGIVPIRGSRDHASFQVELSPPSDERATWLTHFLHIGHYEHHTLDEAVVEFVTTAATYIGYFGEVYLEVLHDAGGEPIQLDTLPPGRVVRAPRSYLQLIPKADRERVDGRRFVAIPKERMWRLDLPRQLGTAREHRRLLRRLAAWSHPTAPFALRPDFGRSSGYEFSAHRKASDRLLEKATKRWGTVLSQQRPVDGSAEYFYIARRLAFYQAQALLREHLIAQLNEQLAALGISHTVRMTGIPAAREISEALQRLQTGEVTFADALEATRT